MVVFRWTMIGVLPDVAEFGERFHGKKEDSCHGADEHYRQEHHPTPVSR